MSQKRTGTVKQVDDAKRTVWVSFENSPERAPQAFKLSRSYYNMERPQPGDQAIQHENKQLELV